MYLSKYCEHNYYIGYKVNNSHYIGILDLWLLVIGHVHTFTEMSSADSSPKALNANLYVCQH